MSRVIRDAHAENFTLVANATLRDSTLSLRARGLLAVLLSRPDDWTVIQGELESLGPDGRHAVRAARRELEAAGYLDIVTRNTPHGREVQSTLRERPQRRFSAAGDRRPGSGDNERTTEESLQSVIGGGPCGQLSAVPTQVGEQMELSPQVVRQNDPVAVDALEDARRRLGLR